MARGAAAQHRGEQPPDFMKMTTEDALEQEMELAPDSMEMTTEDGVEQDMKMVLDSITSLEAEKVISSMRTAKHGTMRTHGSIHALAAVSSTRTTPSTPCSAASRWTASFSSSSTRACCRGKTTTKHR
jgi:hypothetical protein